MRGALAKLYDAAVKTNDIETLDACRLAAIERVTLHLLQQSGDLIVAKDYGEFMLAAANRGRELREGVNKRWPNRRKDNA